MNTTMKHILYVAAIFVAILAFNINNLSAQDQILDEFDLEIQEWTQSCNQEIISLFENYLNSGALTLAQLFDTFYIPIPGTEPPKYSTQYDKILEKSLQTILDSYLNKDKAIVYVMAVDKYGYLPAYNSKFSSSLTGRKEEEFKNNKIKRILNDRIGLAASKNTNSYLIQLHLLDSGEEIMDFSIPLIVENRHWGAVRIGYMKYNNN
ncbi:MAG: chemotaxis protein [Desulfobacteraceae bacterium]|nr:chemotaxis protein [Desulfobacteraceae bacterium]